MTQFLMPYWLRYLGVTILLAGFILMMTGVHWMNWHTTLPVLLVGSLYFMVFTREKSENKQTANIRYHGLVNAFGMLISIQIAYVVAMLIWQPQPISVPLIGLCFPTIFAGIYYLIFFYTKLWFSRADS